MGTPRHAREDNLDRFNFILARVIVFVATALIVITGSSAVFKNLLAPEKLARARLIRAGYELNNASIFKAIEREDVVALKRLGLAGLDLNQPNTKGDTPLVMAVKSENLQMIRELETLGISTKQHDGTGRSVESLAMNARNHELTSFLLERGANPNVEVEPGMPAVAWAIQHEDPALLRMVLAAGADVSVDSKLGSPLYLALLSGDTAIIDQMISLSASPDSFSPANMPLGVAALELERPDLAQRLLNFGADPNLRGSDSSSILETAFARRDRETFELAMRMGGDLGAEMPDGKSMLEHAVVESDSDWMNLLLAHGADPNQRSKVAGNPLWWEKFNEGSPVEAELLLGAGADINAFDGGGVRPIDRAIEIDNHKMVRYLFSRGATTSGHLWYPLQDKNHDMMRLLLAKNREEVNNPAASGLSPFAYTIMKADMTGAALLLEYGAKFESDEKPQGQSLLHWAIANKNTDMAELLLDMGADPNERLPNSPSSEFKSKLQEHGNLTFYLTKDRGLTPIMVAAGSRQLEMAQLLMKKGASRSKNTYGWKRWPVSFAIGAKDMPMAQLMLGREPETNGYSRKVVINLSTQRLTFYENGKATYSTRVSTGKRGYRTPTGTFIITDKERLRHSTIYGSAMPYFQRLSGSAIGMHQGNCPGYAASHGCIRMPWTGAKAMYYKTKVGDIIEVQ